MEHDKIGIFVSEQHGDIALCTCVLKYKDILWPDKKIVWYCSLSSEKSTYLDMLKFNDAIYEIRDWPQENFRNLKNENGQLRLERRQDFDSMKDLHNGYFPAPWAMLPNNTLNDVNYANIPRAVYGADPSWEWHPYLCFSDEEREMAKEFCSNLPYSKTIMLETQLRSAGDFRLGEDVIKNVMQLYRNKLGNCNFIFASKLDYSNFTNEKGVVSCSHFTVRQTALVYNYCDLFIGVSSGITVATSCWGNKPIIRIELGGNTTNYSIIANGPTIHVNIQDIPTVEQNRKLENAVIESLNKIEKDDK
jgi:hypothetical protein